MAYGYQRINNSMFDSLKFSLESAGVKVGPNWSATKERLARQARAQLSRRDLRPATVAKWHRLGVIAIAGRKLRH